MSALCTKITKSIILVPASVLANKEIAFIGAYRYRPI